jgi:coenzyme F420-0:L-glutamate ligase/coenzyme F420-1:gamma-L-glutamate ligase
MHNSKKIEIIGIENIPLIKEGDDLSKIILDNIERNELRLDNGDIIVIAQIIVSKRLGDIRDLNSINPSKEALRIYQKIKEKTEAEDLPIKEPELIQAILDESKKLIKSSHILITETKHGFICANAGIDKSNVGEGNVISLLPADPDKEADKIRKAIKQKTNKDITVIISDSFGRPFRVGSVGVAIGVSGIAPLLDKRGATDLFKKDLKTTIIGQIDNLASAAQLLMGESDEGIPAVLIKGYSYNTVENVSINSILREPIKDLFRSNKEDLIKEVLKNRRSYKLPFQERIVNIETIKDCIKISRWAPSAHNGQFWRYIILKRGEVRKNLIDKMNDKMREDLQRDNRSQQFIEKNINKTRESFLKAPLLVLLCLDKSDLQEYSDAERSRNEYLLGIQSISTCATYFLLSLESKGLAGS